MFEKLKAFTLAEALIVITIIGVIAAVALPAYKSNYLTKTYAAGLKKNFYVLKTALERYELDNFRKIKGTITSDFIEKLTPYLNVHKVCAPTGEEGEGLCPLATDYESYNEIGILDASWKETLYKYGSIVLNDGSLIMVGQTPLKGGYHQMNFIYVDVNGYGKGPNRMGDDLHSLVLMKETGELMPNGSIGTGSYEYDRRGYCNKKASGTNLQNGMTCSYYVLRDLE